MSTSLARRTTVDRQDEVLDRFATINSRQLCEEARLEKCRALKDLRMCGRNVQHRLSCGHSCLCTECAQRSKICPICGKSILPHSSVLRLHNDLLDAGLLLQVRDDDMFQMDGQLCTTDARRLYQFFDVALEHDLVFVICYYVSDVYYDEKIYFSDPALSVLWDHTVVKEWCRKTFQGIKKVLKDIYKLSTLELGRDPKLEMLGKLASKMKGIVTVLETLDIPNTQNTVDSHKDLKVLLESVKRVLQHLEVMVWATRNKVFDSPCARYADFSKWRVAFRQRKQAAQERTWPDYAVGTGQLGGKPSSSLFIEEAILQLQSGSADDLGTDTDFSDLDVLRQSETLSHSFGKPAEKKTTSSVYPPDSMRHAIDNLFLNGRSDYFLAKKTILLYYLFDRLWSSSGQWRPIVDDYVKTFSIPRRFELETFVYFLLDDDSADALQKACEQLADVSSQGIHARMPRVLLERQKPEAALSLLRISGQLVKLQKGLVTVSLQEAVTATRVLLECGSIVEAFWFMRAYVNKVRAGQDGKETEESEMPWKKLMETLVGELCCYCIRKGWAHKVISLTWSSEEKAVVHLCFLAKATQMPAGTAGHLLVLFYIQRCQFDEALRVHKKLSEIEDRRENQNLIHTAREQRSKLMDSCLKLLTDAEKDALETAEKSLDEEGDVGMDLADEPGQMGVASGTTSLLPLSSPLSRRSLLFSKGSESLVSFPPFSNTISNRASFSNEFHHQTTRPSLDLQSSVMDGPGNSSQRSKRTFTGTSVEPKPSNGSSPLSNGGSFGSFFGNGHGLSPGPTVLRKLQYGETDSFSGWGKASYEKREPSTVFADKDAGLAVLSSKEPSATGMRFKLQPPASHADHGLVPSSPSFSNGFQSSPGISGSMYSGGYGEQSSKGKRSDVVFQSPTFSSSPDLSRKWGIAENGMWGRSLESIGEGSDKQAGNIGVSVSPKIGDMNGDSGSRKRGSVDGLTGKQSRHEGSKGGHGSPIAQ